MIFACFLCITNAARILDIFPLAAQSHFNYNHAILKSLHAAGHHITMVTPFPSAKKFENFTYINSNFGGPIHVNQTTINEFADMTLSQIMEWSLPQSIQYCYDIMKLPPIQIRSLDKYSSTLVSDFNDSSYLC